MGKRATKSDTDYLPTHGKWRDKILHTGLDYELEKMLDTIHRYMKVITPEKYQRHPYLTALANDMALRSVEFVSELSRWVDDTYESLLDGGNIK